MRNQRSKKCLCRNLNPSRAICHSPFLLNASLRCRSKLGAVRNSTRERNRIKPRFSIPQSFFSAVLLKDINTTLVEEFRSYLLNKRVGKRFLKNASANRYISMLRAALYWGMSRGDIASNPVAELNKVMLHEPEAPTRVLEEGSEESKFISALPAGLRLMAIFALQTGARRGDILNLTWEAVRPESVEFCETKDGEKRSIKLNSVAKSILRALGPSTKPQALCSPLTSREKL